MLALSRTGQGNSRREADLRNWRLCERRIHRRSHWLPANGCDFKWLLLSLEFRISELPQQETPFIRKLLVRLRSGSPKSPVAAGKIHAE